MPGITPAPRQQPAAALRKAMRAKPARREEDEQIRFVNQFRGDDRTCRLPACAIPNGGKRGKAEAARLKAMGVEAGAPDWVLLCEQRGALLPSTGLAIEFKDPEGTGSQSVNQKRWQKMLEEQGWQYEIVTSSQQAWAVVCDYLQLKD